MRYLVCSILILLLTLTATAGTLGVATQGENAGYAAQYLRAYGEDVVTGADAAGAILDTIAFYGRAYVADAQIRWALFDDNSSMPGNQVCITDAISVGNTSETWYYAVGFSAHSLSASTQYWFVQLTNETPAEDIKIFYTGTATLDVEVDTDIDNTDFPDIPASWGTSDGTENRSYSVYGIYHVPGIAAAYSSSFDQGTNWTNPTNATGSPDNSCATYDLGDQDILTLYNFGFSIPTNATIDSINIDFDGYGTQSQVARRDLEVQLTKTGGGANTGVGDLLSDVRMVEGANCAASGIYNVMGQILWNTTWTYSEINASTFGINIADDDGQAHELGVDAVLVKIFYTEAGVGAYAGQVIPVIGGQ